MPRALNSSDGTKAVQFPFGMRESRMSDRAAEYRGNAEKCRALARDACDREIEQHYLELAEGWLMLATRIEKERGDSNDQ
jgi:hypothetical protein